MSEEQRTRQVEIQQPPAENYAGVVSEVGSEAVKGMAPAERGWILGSVILMLGALALTEITNYLEYADRSEITGAYFEMLEKNRSEENRRLQEQNRILAQALARQSDRIGRQSDRFSPIAPLPSISGDKDDR